VSTVGFAGVRLVGEDPLRAAARPATAGPLYADLAQDRDELRAVAALPAGDHDGQRLAALLAGQMGLVLSPPRERPSP
jgi:hypothetical protein